MYASSQTGVLGSFPEGEISTKAPKSRPLIYAAFFSRASNIEWTRVRGEKEEESTSGEVTFDRLNS